jgi:threonine/homoserine/homoserine lactone efflux protein
MGSLGIQHYEAFLLASLALNLTPGLDTFYILTRSGREGHAVGMAAALGINAGCIVHTLAAVLGISAILMTSALAFSVLKYLGAAYLVWIGLRMLLSRATERQPTETRGRGLSAAFRQGMLTNVLHPKVALFFLAFLP